ncbi:MAG TPA: hypothetical protein VEA69_12965 [Tepidisphaeraceae bacterium]|nr:hypothetical protein [Tepidisphaeraceae bacterium]
MPVKTLCYEHLLPSGESELRRVPDPEWVVVESAILAMDGDSRSLVMLNPTADHDILMGIGDGSDGLRCCFVVTPSGDEVALVDPDEPSRLPTSVLMGQASTRARNELVGVEAVLSAARWYFDHGGPHPKLVWRDY